MTVTRIPGEFRYWVSSESRSGVEHLVDLAYVEEPWQKPHAVCSCWRCFCGHEKYCRHIEQVVKLERERLGV